MGNSQHRVAQPTAQATPTAMQHHLAAMPGASRPGPAFEPYDVADVVLPPPGGIAPMPNVPPLARIAGAAPEPLNPAGLPAPPPGALALPLTAVVLGADTRLGRQLIKECLRMEMYTDVIAISEAPVMLASELKLPPERAEKLRALVVAYDMIEDGLRPLAQSALRVIAFSCLGVTKEDANSPRDFNRLNFEVPMRFVGVMLEGNILRVSVLSHHLADMGSMRSEIRRLRGFMETEIQRMWQDELYIQTWYEKGLEPGLVFFQAPMLLTPGLRLKGEYRHLTGDQPMSRKQLAKQRLALRFGVGPNFAMKTRDVAKAMAHEARTFVLLMDSRNPEHHNQVAQLHSYAVEAEEIEELAEQCREEDGRNIVLAPEQVLRNRLMAHAVTYQYGEAADFDRRVVRRENEYDYVPPTVAARQGAVLHGAPLDAVRERELVELGAMREREVMQMEMGVFPPPQGHVDVRVPPSHQLPPPPPVRGIGGTTQPGAAMPNGPDGPFVNNPDYPNLIQDPSFRPGGPEYEAVMSEIQPQIAADGGFGPIDVRGSGGRCYPGMHLGHFNPAGQHALENEVISRMDPYARENSRYETSRMLGRARDLKEYNLEETRKQRMPQAEEPPSARVAAMSDRFRGGSRHGGGAMRRRSTTGIGQGVPSAVSAGVAAAGLEPRRRRDIDFESRGDMQPPLTSAEALQASVAFDRQPNAGRGADRRRRTAHPDFSDEEQTVYEKSARRERSRSIHDVASMYSTGSEDGENGLGQSFSGFRAGGRNGRNLRGGTRGGDGGRGRGYAERVSAHDNEDPIRSSLRRVHEGGDEASDAIRVRLRNLADRLLGPPSRPNYHGRHNPGVAI